MFDGCDNLSQDVTLEVDNKKVNIPPKVQGLIVVNLPSYASGVNMWAGPIPPGISSSLSFLFSFLSFSLFHFLFPFFFLYIFAFFSLFFI